ncbi:MAG: DNA polymerase III subunit gamma/tau [Lachnospiraceae bacterium]|nr:DNA polymerase III subunit gamma/tau [Lachnospiraceae bacterium]
MSYVALYRKARPPVFDEVKGQDHVIKTLRNQVISDRLQHAYLFCGTRGTGKTSAAKILARAVNCENPQNGNPCNECASCRAIAAGSAMNVIEIDAASNNGVDNIREIVEEVRYRPAQGKYKVYIIDEVHMLSTGAFNALLKTLEEPPSYVIFILATTEVAKIPITILSRCQRYDFHRIGADTITDRMRELTERENVKAEEKALRFIARAADGSMRDALSLLDRCFAFYAGEEITYEKALAALGAVDTDVYTELLSEIARGNAGRSIFIFEKMIENGREVGQFVNDFIWYLRNLLLIGTSENESEDVVDVSAEQREAMKEMAARVPQSTVMRYIRVLSELLNSLRNATNRRVLTEVALVKLTKPQMERTSDAVLDRIRLLEEKLEDLEANGITVQAGPSQGSFEPENEEPEPDPDYVPPNAAPEELVRIAADWSEVTNVLRTGAEDSQVTWMVVKNARPFYNGESAGDCTLYLKPKPGEENLWDGRLFKEGNAENVKKRLEEAIARRFKVHADVVLMRSDDSNERLGAVKIDDILRDRSKIGMPIDVVDDFDAEG